MALNKPNQMGKTLTAIMSILVLAALCIAMVGAVAEADCGDDCQSEKSDCCECICCPSKVVMTLSNGHAYQFEYEVLYWTIESTKINSAQVWFEGIDRPPQNIA